MPADYTVVDTVERVGIFKHMVSCIIFSPRKEKLLRDRWGVGWVSVGVGWGTATRTRLMAVNQLRSEDGAIAQWWGPGCRKTGW